MSLTGFFGFFSLYHSYNWQWFPFHTLALRMTFKTASDCAVGAFPLCLDLSFKRSDVNDSFWTLPQITSRMSYFSFLPAVTLWVRSPYFFTLGFLDFTFWWSCISVCLWRNRLFFFKSSLFFCVKRENILK